MKHSQHYFNFIFIFFVSLVFSCKTSSNTSKSKEMPVNPSKIEISWNKDGGMLIHYEKIFLSKDSCIFEVNRQGNIQKINFKLSNKTIDSLYEYIVENNFGKIKTYEHQVYDRGGTSIQVNADNNFYAISNSGMSFIDDKDIEKYKNIENKILELSFQELNKLKKEYTFLLDESILNTADNIIFSINGETIYNKKNDGEYFAIPQSLFDMNNFFKISYYQFDKNKGYDVFKNEFNLIIEELKVENIQLYIRDEQLMWK